MCLFLDVSPCCSRAQWLIQVYIFGAEYHGGYTEAKISQVRGSPVLSNVLASVLAVVEFVVICASF